ncbi:hypothetical protein NDU88_001172 [Pleurodeles waltl]|uniref:Uncharacterized protein n=1 Tax=Pleurodeles waltl TaxID=8319 RepID=A0AAV7R892_PLEWA|nr:hypothetical protein NDU88_001172 [Pleurodeles waltl]
MSRCAKLLGDAVGANSAVPMKNYLWLDLVYEDTFSGAANILEADSASEDVMDNYDIPAQEVEVSKDHPDNLGRNVTYRSRLGTPRGPMLACASVFFKGPNLTTKSAPTVNHAASDLRPVDGTI